MKISYTYEELKEALRAIDSIIHKCEKAQEKFPQGNRHHTLLRNRLKAMYISRDLITQALTQASPAELVSPEEDSARLLSKLNLLRTTELGANRVKKNLELDDSVDVVSWCREMIQSPGSRITQRGKNWYIDGADCRITVNASSYTIITAHRNH